MPGLILSLADVDMHRKSVIILSIRLNEKLNYLKNSITLEIIISLIYMIN